MLLDRGAEQVVLGAQRVMTGQVEEVALREPPAIHALHRTPVARVVDQDAGRLGREFGQVHARGIAWLA
jgi:hypothetical protein